MMLLGLVLHSALTYNITNHGEGWPMQDPGTTHIFSDSMVFLIHSFRMPLFFMVAGFFGAMLFYERQTASMIKNRLQRIAIPFVVFLFVLWPVIIFSFSYTTAAFSYRADALGVALDSFTSLESFIPQSTSHLWFLYYLCMFTTLSVFIVLLMRQISSLSRILKQAFRWVIQRPIARVLVFSVLTYIILSLLGTSLVAASTSLVPDIDTFTYFLFFYLIGWLLYKSRDLLHTLMQYDWLSIIAAFGLLITQGTTIQSTGIAPDTNTPLMIAYSSLIVCLLLFGITGLFIRYTSRYSARWRYISDASYWVYLIHLPIAAIVPGLIMDLPVPAVFKFVIVVTTTAIVCFVSYHYLVRNTFIGKFLNGRKYPI